MAAEHEHPEAVSESQKFVDIDGHKVLAHRADEFYDGRTGERVSDEDYDESERRKREIREAKSSNE